MSSTTSHSEKFDDDDIRTVVHSLDQLLSEEEGAVPVPAAMARLAQNTNLPVDTISSILDQENGYALEVQERDGQKTITRADPKTPSPDNVVESFAPQSDITALSSVSPMIAAGLAELGVSGLRDLTECSPDALAANLDHALNEVCPPDDLRSISVLTDAEADALADAGVETFRDLVARDNEVLADQFTTLTVSKCRSASTAASKQIETVDQHRAKQIIKEATFEAPATDWIAESALDRFRSMADDGEQGSAQVRSIEETEDTTGVGRPVAVADNLDPTANRAQYISDLGDNKDNPVPTGFQVLEDTDYDLIPRSEDDPRAGDDALPVDKNGNVVPPAVPTAEHLDRPVDELVAKKLARGAVPVRLVGPPGSGKNYLTKYLAYKTNRGYRSIDVGKSTMPKDLFGPLTPDEDGMVVSRNGPVKQGLLNGDIVVINEFPAMPDGAKMELHRYLNEGKLLIKSHGELIEPHPAARLVVTMNPPTPENRGSEPMPKATRERFRSFRMPYPQHVDEEVESLGLQFNTGRPVVEPDTLEKIVEFAHRTRKDKNSTWPTLSTRSLTVVIEHIDDGATSKGALKNVLGMVAERSERPEAAFEVLDDLF